MVFNSAIGEKTKLIADYIGKLELISKKSEEEFIRDPFIPDAAERNLQLAIEAAADIGNFIIRRKGFESPQSYQDIFRILCDRGVLPLEMRDDIVEMARFRNLLVHGYAKLDKRRVYSILRSDLGQLRKLASLLAAAAGELNKP